MTKFITILAFAAISASASAQADGWVCQTEGGELIIKAYNHVNADRGTRNASVMVLSDPSISSGKKTIARFADVNEKLTNVGASYEATVDLRYNDSNLKGRNIGGTKLGFIKTIVLDVDFSYAAPVASEDAVEGTLTIIKRDGDALTHGVICSRYLKG